MRLHRLVKTACLAAAFCGFAAAAQAQNVLVIDRERVLAESQVGAYIAQQLEQISQQMQTELAGRAQPLQEEEQRLSVEAQALTPEAIQQRPDLMQRIQSLNTQGQEFNQLQQQRVNELNATRQQALEPVARAVAEIEQAIMQERSAAIVLDYNVAYQVSPSVDITSAAIEQLNGRMTTTPVTRVTLPAQQQPQQPAQ